MKDSHSNTFDAKETLRKTELFQCLDDDAIDLVANLVKWKRYLKGVEVLPYKGESDNVFFIASGQVRITIFSFTGKEISYQELGPGEMFGELSAID